MDGAGTGSFDPEATFDGQRFSFLARGKMCIRVCSLTSANVQRGPVKMPLAQRLGAEEFGTFWLVFGGCGSAVIAAEFPEVEIRLLIVSLTFGLAALPMAKLGSRVFSAAENATTSTPCTAAKPRLAGKL